MWQHKKHIVSCKQCGVARAAAWMMHEEYKSGCARKYDVDALPGAMCASMRIELLHDALRRALRPDAYDDKGKLKSDLLFSVIDSETEALRAVAALRGPIVVPSPENVGGKG